MNETKPGPVVYCLPYTCHYKCNKVFQCRTIVTEFVYIELFERLIKVGFIYKWILYAVLNQNSTRERDVVPW